MSEKDVGYFSDEELQKLKLVDDAEAQSDNLYSRSNRHWKATTHNKARYFLQQAGIQFRAISVNSFLIWDSKGNKHYYYPLYEKWRPGRHGSPTYQVHDVVDLLKRLGLRQF